MGDKLFSIITVCYNSEKTIERTIKSVLAQTYADYEYIIVDGVSKDSTLDIIKKYEPLFEGRMKWQSEPDKGIYDAMNKGILRSNGVIIGIVNSDDWLEPDALENVAKSYEGFNCDSVCFGWMNFHYCDDSIQVLETDECILRQMAKVYEMAGVRHPATFVPKNVYNKLGVFDTRLRIKADTDLILRFLENNVEFFFLNKVLTNMSDGGISNVALMKACKDYSQILKKRNVCGVKYFSLYYRWCLKRFIKGLLPISVMKLYRSKMKR